MLFARDIMTTDVITVSLHTTLDETVELLLEHGISGVPVVDDDQNVVGIISEFALLSLAYEPNASDELVVNYMSRRVITVEENTLISDVADLFIQNRVRRVPVTVNNELCGIISRRDLLRASRSRERRIAHPEPFISQAPAR